MAEAQEPRRFVILCLGRTGSTHLQSMLDHHSQASCWGEVFGEGKAPTFAASRHTDAGAFIDELLGGADARAAGFKLPVNSIRLTPAAADVVRDDATMAVIRLTRRNRLAMLVSRQLLASTGVSQSIFGSYGDATVRIEPQACLAALARIEEEEAELDAIAAGHETFAIAYEELGEPERLDELQRFLGLDPEPLRSWFEKLRKGSLAETVENWDELAGALRGTRWEPLLSEPG